MDSNSKKDFSIIKGNDSGIIVIERLNWIEQIYNGLFTQLNKNTW